MLLFLLTVTLGLKRSRADIQFGERSIKVSQFLCEQDLLSLIKTHFSPYILQHMLCEHIRPENGFMWLLPPHTASD